MNALAPIRRLHEHRIWVNRNLCAAAQTLDDEKLRRQLAIGQGSVWKSLLHMYAAEFVWLECLLGHEQASIPGDIPDKLPGNQLGQGGIGSLAELIDHWQQLDKRWSDYLWSVTADASAIPSSRWWVTWLNPARAQTSWGRGLRRR